MDSTRSRPPPLLLLHIHLNPDSKFRQTYLPCSSTWNMHGTNRDKIRKSVPRHERNHGNTKKKLRSVCTEPIRHQTPRNETNRKSKSCATKKTGSRTNHGRRHARWLHQCKKENHHMLSSMHRDDFCPTNPYLELSASES